MPADTPTDGRCNYRYTPDDGYKHDSGYCGSHPMDNGLCYHHGGQRENGGAPEGNTNAATHELYAQESSYYQNRSDVAQGLIDSIYADYREEYEAKHGDPPQGDDVMLFKVAVGIHKQLKADDWEVIKPDSVQSGHPMVDRSEKKSPQGETYYEYVETAVARAEAKVSREVRQWLKHMDLDKADGGDTTVNVNVHEEILSGMKAAHES